MSATIILGDYDRVKELMEAKDEEYSYVQATESINCRSDDKQQTRTSLTQSTPLTLLTQSTPKLTTHEPSLRDDPFFAQSIELIIEKLQLLEGLNNSMSAEELPQKDSIDKKIHTLQDTWSLIKKELISDPITPDTEKKLIEPNTDKKQTEIDDDYIEPDRFCFLKTGKCMLCNKKYETKCNEIIIGDDFGWIYCGECEKTKEINKSIICYLHESASYPCYWLSELKEKLKIKSYYPELIKDIKDDPFYNHEGGYIHFFNQSQMHTKYPVQTGRICLEGLHVMQFSGDDEKFGFGVYVTFLNAASKSSSKRFVSLANLFYHTPGLYEEITSCENLFASDKVFISHKDTPIEVRKLIDEAYNTAKACKNSREFPQ